jgi:hypothetical protein
MGMGMGMGGFGGMGMGGFSGMSGGAGGGGAGGGAGAGAGAGGKKRGFDETYEENSRLYIAVRSPVPDEVLVQAFGQFDGLVYAHLCQGKLFGFVQYSTAWAAGLAMQTLNGTNYIGQTLNIKIADNPNKRR